LQGMPEVFQIISR